VTSIDAKHRAHASIGLLAGSLGCIAFRHAVAPIVGFPLWVIGICAAVQALGLCVQHRSRHTWRALVAGIVLGLCVPSVVAPAFEGVVTHAIGQARGVDLFDALQRLDDDPQSLEGTVISVSGRWREDATGAPSSVYRTVMSCCAADAIDAGFDVVPAKHVALPDGLPVRVTGIVRAYVSAGEIRYRLVDASVTQLHGGACC